MINLYEQIHVPSFTAEPYEWIEPSEGGFSTPRIKVKFNWQEPKDLPGFYPYVLRYHIYIKEGIIDDTTPVNPNASNPGLRYGMTYLTYIDHYTGEGIHIVDNFANGRQPDGSLQIDEFIIEPPVTETEYSFGIYAEIHNLVYNSPSAPAVTDDTDIFLIHQSMVVEVTDPAPLSNIRGVTTDGVGELFLVNGYTKETTYSGKNIIVGIQPNTSPTTYTYNSWSLNGSSDILGSGLDGGNLGYKEPYLYRVNTKRQLVKYDRHTNEETPISYFTGGAYADSVLISGNDIFVNSRPIGSGAIEGLFKYDSSTTFKKQTLVGSSYNLVTNNIAGGTTPLHSFKYTGLTGLKKGQLLHFKYAGTTGSSITIESLNFNGTAYVADIVYKDNGDFDYYLIETNIPTATLAGYFAASTSHWIAVSPWILVSGRYNYSTSQLPDSNTLGRQYYNKDITLSNNSYFYTTVSNYLVKIDKTTGAKTAIGASGNEYVGLCYNDNDSNIYGLGTDRKIYSVNPTSGVKTVFADLTSTGISNFRSYILYNYGYIYVIGDTSASADTDIASVPLIYRVFSDGTYHLLTGEQTLTEPPISPGDENTGDGDVSSGGGGGTSIGNGDHKADVPDYPTTPTDPVVVTNPEDEIIGVVPIPPGTSPDAIFTLRKNRDRLYILLDGKVLWSYYLNPVELLTWNSSAYRGWYQYKTRIPIETPPEAVQPVIDENINYIFDATVKERMASTDELFSYSYHYQGQSLLILSDGTIKIDRVTLADDVQNAIYYVPSGRTYVIPGNDKSTSPILPRWVVSKLVADGYYSYIYGVTV